jgi:hypothetical protein
MEVYGDRLCIARTKNMHYDVIKISQLKDKKRCSNQDDGASGDRFA